MDISLLYILEMIILSDISCVVLENACSSISLLSHKIFMHIVYILNLLLRTCSSTFRKKTE